MVLPAGCGGSGRQAGYLDRGRLEDAVRREVEQSLMTSSPREPGAASATHVRSVECERLRGTGFRCRITLGNGARTTWDISVAGDGRRYTVERTGAGVPP
jgi:hypothetical protein